MSRLRVLREAMGLSVREAAKNIGISAATLSRAERDRDMRLSTAYAIAKGYRMTKLAEQIELLWQPPQPRRPGRDA